MTFALLFSFALSYAAESKETDASEPSTHLNLEVDAILETTSAPKQICTSGVVCNQSYAYCGPTQEDVDATVAALYRLYCGNNN